MNTTASTRVDHNQHPPQSVQHSTTLRRVRFGDRIALHLGLALITWSRRPRKTTESFELFSRRSDREWRSERRWRLNEPPR